MCRYLLNIFMRVVCVVICQTFVWELCVCRYLLKHLYESCVCRYLINIRMRVVCVSLSVKHLYESCVCRCLLNICMRVVCVVVC